MFHMNLIFILLTPALYFYIVFCKSAHAKLSGISRSPVVCSNNIFYHGEKNSDSFICIFIIIYIIVIKT